MQSGSLGLHALHMVVMVFLWDVSVGHGFISHDIEGPAWDMELYTRWIQIGAFSGVMRSHDRGVWLNL